MQEGTSLVWRNAFFPYVLTIGDVVDSTADTYTYTYTYTYTLIPLIMLTYYYSLPLSHVCIDFAIQSIYLSQPKTNELLRV